MPAFTKSSLLFFLFWIPGLLCLAQDPPEEEKKDGFLPELIAFTSIPANGDLYFKSTLKGPNKEMQLLLEKEIPGKEKPVVVDSKKVLQDEKGIPLLYCFKDTAPKQKASLYRLKGIRFSQNGEVSVHTIAEKRFTNQLLSMKRNDP